MKHNKLEELEGLRIELNAYMKLIDEAFDFGEGLMVNNGEYEHGSEYIYYKLDLISVEEAIEFFDEQEKPRKNKKRLNRYHKKMYHKKYKHLSKIKNGSPWFVYTYDYNKDIHIYYDRCYVGSDFFKKISNKKIRRVKPGKEEFELKGYSCHKLYDYWNKIF